MLVLNNISILNFLNNDNPVHKEKGFFRFCIPIYLTEICFIETTYVYTKHYLFK